MRDPVTNKLRTDIIYVYTYIYIYIILYTVAVEGRRFNGRKSDPQESFLSCAGRNFLELNDKFNPRPSSSSSSGRPIETADRP